MNDYSKLNLTNGMLAVNSPLNRKPQVMGADFDTQYEVQTRNVTMSALGFNNFSVLSNVSAVTGPTPTASTTTLTTTLSPTNQPPLFYKNFAIPFVSAYEGTSAVGSMQVYPTIGAGITSDKYRAMSGFDYAAYTGTNSVFKVAIYNNSGGSVNLHFVTQWKYTNHGKSNS